MSSDSQTVTVNGNTYDAETAAEGIQFINERVQPQARTTVGGGTSGFGGSRIRTPGDLRALFGSMYGGDRDVWDVLGYDTEVDADDYRAKYRRQDIARRIVELPAQDTWRKQPEVFDTDGDEPESEFETAVEALLSDQLNDYCRRADIAAGIGEYGLLFIGFADGADSLSDPVNESAVSGVDDIAYFAVYAQDQVQGWQLGKDIGRGPTDERFNKPIEYDIDFGDLDGDSSEDDIKTVHWSRVIHIAEGAVESDLKGTPRLRPVYNRLDDLEKVVGASAEMYWTGAAPRYQFDVRDGYADIPDSELSNLDDKVQAFVHDMQPHIKTMGMDINEFGGQDVNPEGVVDSTLKFISGATGIPLRKLIGSERGEQASTQDRANWFDQVESRQRNYAESQILRSVIDRLRSFDVLPDPRNGEYRVEWPSLFSLNEKEESETQFNRARAAQAAAPQGNTDLLPGGMDGVIEYLETGAFPEPEADVPETPLDEDDPAVRDQFNDSVGGGD